MKFNSTPNEKNRIRRMHIAESASHKSTLISEMTFTPHMFDMGMVRNVADMMTSTDPTPLVDQDLDDLIRCLVEDVGYSPGEVTGGLFVMDDILSADIGEDVEEDIKVSMQALLLVYALWNYSDDLTSDHGHKDNILENECVKTIFGKMGVPTEYIKTL